MIRNSKLLALGALALVAATGAGCAGLGKTEPFRVERESTATVTARVKSVDVASRKVVLVGSDGEEATIEAGEEVRNLAQLRPGDVVVAQYQETLIAEVRKPTDEEKANPLEMVGGAERAALGDLPGAAGVQALRFVGTIAAIDKGTHMITFRNLNGKTLTVEAENPENLDKVKVGDPVVLIFAEAVAIGVEPVGER
jgi:hypothetical protein